MFLPKAIARAEGETLSFDEISKLAQEVAEYDIERLTPEAQCLAGVLVSDTSHDAVPS